MSASANEIRIQTVCLLILATGAIMLSLYWLQPVMVPFVLALLLALILSPVIDFQVRWLRVPRIVAVILTLVLGIVLVFAFTWVVMGALQEFAISASVYQYRLEYIISQTIQRLPLERMGLAAAPDIGIQTLFSGLDTRTLVNQLSSTITQLFSKTTLVMLFLFFILLGATTRRYSPGSVASEIELRVKRYVITKVVISAVTGALVFAILTFLGVKYAAAFGVFAFLLNFIPSIGSIVASLLPVPVVLLTPDVSTSTAILAIVLPSVTQFVIGNILEPKIMGDRLDMHPVTILFALIFWSTIWGIVGMFLAVPITAVIQIILQKIDITAPVATLLAGRGGLLAGDDHEPKSESGPAA